MPYTFQDLYNDQKTYLASQIGTKTRLSELNEGYRKRYAKYVDMMSVVVLAVLIYLGVSMLQRALPIISNTVVDTILVILIFAVSIYLMLSIVELWSRSAINYDELDVPVMVDASGATAIKGPAGQIMPSQCTTKDCCDGLGGGYTWDAASSKCLQCQGAECCGEGTHWGGSTKCYTTVSGTATNTCDTGYSWTNNSCAKAESA